MGSFGLGGGMSGLQSTIQDLMGFGGGGTTGGQKRHKKKKKDKSTDDSTTQQKAEPSSYKKGGKVKKSGLAKVHKGEIVITASQAKSRAKHKKKKKHSGKKVSKR